MFKTPLIATLLLASVAAPAVAAPQAKTSFTHDGVTYFYTETKAGQSTVISGYAENGPNFHYVVRKGQVYGKVDGTNVSFDVKDAADVRGQIKIALASR